MSSKSFQNADKLEGVVSVTQFGAVGDGVTDDTAAIQAAINYAQSSGQSLYITSTLHSYKITSPLIITSGVSIIGDGYSPTVGSNFGNRGPGSWLQFSHLGHGIVIDNAGSLISGVFIEKIGTFRNQVTPEAGWAPLQTGYDINIGNADVHIANVMLWNCSYGIQINSTSGGRLQVDGLQGQPLIKGIHINICLDVCRLNNIHFWPYWYNDNTYVNAYTKLNLIGILLERADNAIVTNFFCIFVYDGIRFGFNATGYSQRVQLSNIGIDSVSHASINVIAGADGTSFMATNLYGYSSGNVSYGLLALASNCIIQMSNVRFSLLGFSASSINGSGNIAQFTNWTIDGYNGANNNSPCFFSGGGNKTYISDKPIVTATNPANLINSTSTASVGHIVATGAYIIPNPSLSIVITHNLGYTPQPYQINLQPNSSQTPAGVYVDTITETQFTIRCFPAATGSANGNWSIDGRSSI